MLEYAQIRKAELARAPRQDRLLGVLIFLGMVWLFGGPLAAQANLHENIRLGRNVRKTTLDQHWLKIEEAIFEEVNRVRTSHGLPPLFSDSGLSDVARRHSRDMIARNYFDHMSPELHTPGERVRQQTGRPFDDIAENLWMRLGALPYESPDQSARKIVQDWLESSSHRRNILAPIYTHLGVGFFGSPDGLRLRATQLFAHAPDFVETSVLPQR